MSTPIYEALKKEHEFTPMNFRSPTPIEAAAILSAGRTWPPAETLVTFKPEPTWRTFMRCLGWWKK